MAKKYFVEVTEEIYGVVASFRVECPVASESILKKMWKHYFKMYRSMDGLSVYAYVEDEDRLHDLSMLWMYQEQEHAVMSGAIPFCC